MMTALAMKEINDLTWRDEIVAHYTGDCRNDEPLSQHTTMRVGGPADLMVFPQDVQQLKKMVQLCMEYRIRYMMLGAGSNLLVRDSGIRGVVICLEQGFRNYEVLEDDASDPHCIRIFVESGVSLPRLIVWAAGQGYIGLETLTGIPGSMGGVLKMNAGTRRGEVQQVVESLRLMTKSGRIQQINADDLGFAYRSLKLSKHSIILNCILKLKSGAPKDARSMVKEGLDYRAATQPVGQSAGCIFRNPSKNSAGKLLDEAGLKGVRVRGARVSEIHANFIMNEKKATAKDVIALIRLMRDRVKDRFNVKLETEISIMGEA